MQGTALQLIVTGWRGWPHEHRQIVWDALDAIAHTGWPYGGITSGVPIPRVVTVHHGQCPLGGVDTFADMWACDRTHRGGPRPSRYPADFAGEGPSAGPRRNQRMIDAAILRRINVDRGALLCAAFPGPGSRGTWDCVQKAAAVGIPIIMVPYPPRLTEGLTPPTAGAAA